jgi:L-ascorbate metabolism protein UlaG (beta-lactamase superfamily)
VQSNPACPDSEKEFDQIDYMLCTHGHYDHIQDAVVLAKKYKPKVIAILELCKWLENKGVENLVPMNLGGTFEVDGIAITMVRADHSCGIIEPDGNLTYGGHACGYVVTLENHTAFYHAGDTAVFSDMKLIAEIYRPALAMLPIGDRFTMSPREAVYACQLLGCNNVIPMHHDTFDSLTGTPQEFRALSRYLVGMNIIDLLPGQSHVLSGAEHGLG